MEKQLKEIEIPFGAKDSELCGWEYSIPEGMEATIVDNKIVVKKKESEDEKVKKELIYTINLAYDCGIAITKENRDKYLAWIEKQGEHKEINLVEVLKHYPRETKLYSPLYGKLWLAEVDEEHEIITCYKYPLENGCTRAVLEQEETVSFYSDGTTGLPDFNISKDCMLFLYNNKKQDEQKTVDEIAKEVCKDKASAVAFLKSTGIINENGELAEQYRQDKQNPNDNVEPKFKVGDWIVYNRNDSSREILYVYDIRDDRYYFNDNIHFSWSVKECDEKCHLWTIDDVKDGDVVAQEPFGTYEKPFVAIYKGRGLDHFVSYCFTSFDGKFNEGTGGHCLNVHPATKEQCEQLEKAMTDAGFTFDFDKKELKKIEKNPAWSEEDEEMIKSLVTCLDELEEENGWNYVYVVDKSIGLSRVRKWLNSIKDRIYPQPKQEWSEEDEYVFNKILNWCVLVNPTSSIFEELPKDKFVEIFKSLKDRVQSQIIAGDNQCK